MKKKILTIASLTLLTITIILAIITLINYYNYVGVLNNLKDVNLSLIDKFDLQGARDTYLYNTLSILPWTCYVGIISIATTITSYILVRPKATPKKIR